MQLSLFWFWEKKFKSYLSVFVFVSSRNNEQVCLFVCLFSSRKSLTVPWYELMVTKADINENERNRMHFTPPD